MVLAWDRRRDEEVKHAGGTNVATAGEGKCLDHLKSGHLHEKSLLFFFFFLDVKGPKSLFQLIFFSPLVCFSCFVFFLLLFFMPDPCGAAPKYEISPISRLLLWTMHLTLCLDPLTQCLFFFPGKGSESLL